MTRPRILFAFLVLVVVLAGYVAGCASGGGQPHMAAARGELVAARDELNAAAADKGGHRERAISLVNDAIAEVQAGIDYAASR